MKAKAMEAGKILESTCEEPVGVREMECGHSLTEELERPSSVVSFEVERESERP
jgi:hypothetical protein